MTDAGNDTNSADNNHVARELNEEKRESPVQESQEDTSNDLEKGQDKSTEKERPYSVFTKNQKWFILAFVSFAGLFRQGQPLERVQTVYIDCIHSTSPLTSSIYLPAIPTLTKVFNKSTEQINLTVTIYIVMQGLAPMVWGPVSDRWGRRIAYCLCILILALTCIGLALTPTNAFWLLLLLRCLQAAGSASTIAIGAGVIGDMATAKERGGFFGIFTLGPLIGPAVAPTIGGALANSLGWRAIFWFMTIAASCCFVILLLFLPETLRSRVGDGSITPSPFHKPIVPLIHYYGEPHPDTIPKTKPHPNPLLLLLNLDIVVILAFTGILCAVFYGFLTTISSLFAETYPHLNETQIGLCFLGIGGGMAISTVVAGKLLDWEYKKLSKATNMGKDSDDYPIEKARLRLVPYQIILLIICSAGYGFALKHRVNLAVPLILQVIVGGVTTATLNASQTLMVDSFPGQGSSITACNNLVRCSLSAVLVSVIELIIRGIGVEWTYLLLAGVSLLALPMVYIILRIGPACRKRRKMAAK